MSQYTRAHTYKTFPWNENFLDMKFTSTHLILYGTYQSLSNSQTFSPDSHLGTVTTKICLQNISF